MTRYDKIKIAFNKDIFNEEDILEYAKEGVISLQEVISITGSIEGLTLQELKAIKRNDFLQLCNKQRDALMPFEFESETLYCLTDGDAREYLIGNLDTLEKYPELKLPWNFFDDTGKLIQKQMGKTDFERLSVEIKAKISNLAGNKFPAKLMELENAETIEEVLEVKWDG